MLKAMPDAIIAALKDALSDVGITDADFVVDVPTDSNTAADYYSNVAMATHKQFDALEKSALLPDGTPVKSPRDVASLLQAVVSNRIPAVERVEVAGPGFLNFYLTREYFSGALADARAAGDAWGKNDSWADKKVLVEYTDPNPFKEFHIGHLFTNAVGESIARLFMMNGAATKRLNYQGDVGLHVAHAIWGMQQLGITPESGFTAKDLGRAYATGATAYKNGEEPASSEIRDINRQVYSRENEHVNALYDAGRATSLAYFETIYQMVDTQFNEYFFESEAGPRGKELVLDNPDTFPESDGARIFDGEAHGLHTRVFLNKEGLPTYEAKELALAKLKEERCGSYDHSIISTANEITEYFKVLKKAMEAVYPELAAKTEHIGHGTVRLTSGKMSSRTGEVIPAVDFIGEVAAAAKEKMATSGVTEPSDELAEQIAIGAIKYATLRSNILQDSVFDKERALSFEGDSGPYLQYTHARICSVLEKAARAGVVASTRLAPPTAYDVEKLLPQFPRVIAAALAERAPHQVAYYLTELASAFNRFYAEERIADADDEFAPYKAAVSDAVRLTLKHGLWTLGIKAPERM